MIEYQEGQKIEMVNSVNRVNLHLFFFFPFVLSITEEITVQQETLLLVAGKCHL